MTPGDDGVDRPLTAEQSNGHALPMHTPDREDVYAAWLRVQRLREECQRDESDHARLAEARYGKNT
jgi:hypothetical protein